MLELDTPSPAISYTQVRVWWGKEKFTRGHFFMWPFRLYQQIFGDKDPDGFFYGESGGRRGLVPFNMVSEVQVDDPDIAAQLLKESNRSTSSRSMSRNTSRGPSSRGPGSRGPDSRGPGSRGPPSRGPPSRGPPSRGPSRGEYNGPGPGLYWCTFPFIQNDIPTLLDFICSSIVISLLLLLFCQL